MKRLKPGFKAYLKVRFDDPFKFTEDMNITSSSGVRFRDVGSPHTIIIKFGIIIFILFALLTFNWTGDGVRFVIYSGILLLVLHRFLRYFWTDFERVDEEGKIVEDKSLLYVKKRSWSSKVFSKLLLSAGKEEDDEIYYRYKWWQRLLIFLEAVLVFGASFAMPAVTLDSPYSRFNANEAQWTTLSDLPFFGDYLTGESPDPSRGTMPLKRDIETLTEAYEEARGYIDAFCPEAELTDYAATLEAGNTEYDFTFKNYRRGLLYNDDYAIMSVTINAKGDWIRVYYWGYHVFEARFRPVKPPLAEIDTEKIADLILKNTGYSAEDMSYIRIGTHFLPFDSKNIKSYGEGIWAVSITLKDENMYFTVNAEEGAVTREDFYY